MNISKISQRVGVIVMALIVSIQPGSAFMPTGKSTPSFDKRRDARPGAQLSTDRQRAMADLQARIPSVRVDYDPVIGAPAWISRIGFLSGPTGAEVARKGTPGLANEDPHQAIKAFLIENTALFGHGPELLTDATITREFVTMHNGLRTVVWQQQLDGIPVFESVLKAHVTKRGELVNISSQFLPDTAIASGMDRSLRVQLEMATAISATQAVVIALADVGENIAIDLVTATDDPPDEPTRKQTFVAAPLLGESRAELVWLPMNRSALRLCWSVRFVNRSSLEVFRTLVDATSGEALVRQNVTCRVTPATYRVFTGDSPAPMTPGLGSPSSAQAGVVARQPVSLPYVSAVGSPVGWIPDGANSTHGNNVSASLNRNAQDPNPVLPPQGSPFRVFDFSLDLNQEPNAYGNAAVANLFYWCNWMHDKLYDLGFTEAAGNFQDDNFGRGGLQMDRVVAWAQYGADTGIPDNFNNAYFQPDSDGNPGHIIMCLFDGPTPDRDADLSAEIILHEYTHGLSSRLAGDNGFITAFQSQGLGEGWSDFYASALLSQHGDDVHANYPEGGYITYQYGGSGFDQNYYYGIRRYPYSTDMSRNPLTFNDIDPLQFDNCASGAPFSSLFLAFSGDCLFVPAWEYHNVGEVWCVTLWEARANLVERHGYAAGNELILQLVTDGMNLSPANPTFIQARDAMLQADLVNDWGQNQYDLWRAFAKRGMGLGAQGPENFTTDGVVESFDLPPVVRMSAVQWTFPPYVDESYSQYLTFRILRTGPTTSPLWSVTFFLGGDQWGTEWTDAEWPYDFTTLGCYKAPFPNAFYVNIPAGQDHVDVAIGIVDDDEQEWTWERVSPKIPFVPTSFGYVVDPGVRELPLYIIDND